jgi:CLIP-associating protein 1/2
VYFDIYSLPHIYGHFSHVQFLVSFIGDSDITEKAVEPVKLHSEKELLREFEKIAATLVPEKDWSLRIAAMQRIEALVYGG